MCASRCETAQEKWGHFYHFSSLFQMEVGRKKRKAIYTSKKNSLKTQKPFEVLKWAWSRFIGISPPPSPRDVHLTLFPLTMGRCGAEPSILKCSFKQKEKQIPPSTLLSYWGFSRAGDRMSSHVSVTESPQSSVRKGPWTQGIDDKFMQTPLLLIPLRVLLQVT